MVFRLPARNAEEDHVDKPWLERRVERLCRYLLISLAERAVKRGDAHALRHLAAEVRAGDTGDCIAESCWLDRLAHR